MHVCVVLIFQVDVDVFQNLIHDLADHQELVEFPHKPKIKSLKSSAKMHV